MKRGDIVICIDGNGLHPGIRVGDEGRITSVLGLSMTIIVSGTRSIYVPMLNFRLKNPPPPPKLPRIKKQKIVKLPAKILSPEEKAEQKRLAVKASNEAYRGKPGTQKHRDYLDKLAKKRGEPGSPERRAYNDRINAFRRRQTKERREQREKSQRSEENRP